VFVIAIFSVFGLTKSIMKPPVLTLTSSNNIVTDQDLVPVTGVVKNTSVLTINNITVALAKDGSFSTNIPVNVGENSVQIVAGNSSKITQTIKVTRKEIAKAIPATSTSINNNLTTSGPVENTMGSIGISALIVSFLVYRKSKRENPLQKAISLV
jgi:hypothetical protein